MDISQKSKAYMTLAIFAAIAFAFWHFSDVFSLWATTSNPWLVIIVAILINPAYLFLIYILYKQYNWRGLFAGILIAIAIDIISLPHSIPKIGTMPTDSALFGFSDTSLWISMNKFITGIPGTIILYILIATGIVYLAFRIIRRTSSFNKIMKESI